MYCQNCGTPNLEDANFCEACGVKLDKGDIAAASDTDQVTYEYASRQGMTEAVSAFAKPISKWLLLVIGEAICLAVLIFTAYSIACKGVGPERVAENYFVAIANQDWAGAYEKLDIDESRFINAEQFAKINQNKSLGKIHNYAVVRTEGSTGDSFTGASGLRAEIMISYRTKGSVPDNSCRVVLNRQASKQFLLFDEWKVGTENIICTDYLIYVPQGASVRVDGIPLTENDFVSAEQRVDYVNDADDMTCYIIPEIFEGTHVITVEKDDMQTIIEEVTVGDGSTAYDPFDMLLKKEVITEGEVRAAGNEQDAAGMNQLLQETDYASHRYEICVDDVSWEEAFIACKQKGGYLVRINSEEEFQYVIGLIESSQSQNIHFYLGGRRDVDSKRYYWVNIENMLYGESLNPAAGSWASFHWMENEPSFFSAGDNEVYLNLIYYKEAWVLNDVQSDITEYYSGKTGYICEYDE